MNFPSLKFHWQNFGLHQPESRIYEQLCLAIARNKAKFRPYTSCGHCSSLKNDRHHGLPPHEANYTFQQFFMALVGCDELYSKGNFNVSNVDLILA